MAILCTKFINTMLLALLFGFLSCVPTTETASNSTEGSDLTGTAGTSGTGGSSSSDSSSSGDDFSNDLSFIQSGSINYFTIFQLQSDFQGILNLRGKEINNYLSTAANRSVTPCLLARFSTSTSNKLLLLGMNPQLNIDPDTGRQEYFYRLQSLDQSQNLAQCSSAGLLTQLSNLFPGETRAYTYSDVCSNCLSTLQSQGLRVFESSGTEFTFLNTSLIRFQFIKASNPSTTIPVCSSDQACKNINSDYDCCLSGQCVVDKAVRSDIDQTSADFLSAKLTITQNPSRISEFPQFYYLCPSGSSTEPGGSSGEEDVPRLTKLQRLHDCTNPQDNEVGLCTITYEDASTTITAGGTFSVRNDDTDFVDIWSGPVASLADFQSKGAITKIEFAGKVLYDENHYSCMRTGFECYDGSACTNDTSLCPIEKATATTPDCDFNPSGNDVDSNSTILSDAQCVMIKSSFANPSNAAHDRLEITYQVDGSCERLSTLVARCEKHYVQGQANFTADDHSPASQNFKLPSYADLTKQITVFIDGLQTFQTVDWNLVGDEVQFNTGSVSIVDGEKIRMQFFVDISAGKDSILESQDAALTEINSYCKCEGNTSCGLTEVKQTVNGVETIVDYACDYPDPITPDPPIEQTVFLDSRSVPMRYYDTSGKSVDTPNGSSLAQEGTAFEYTSSNKLIPNNVSTYIGFNEIYGTLGTGINNARAPLQVDISSGKSYNIFVNSGAMSPCSGCGTDYYSSLSRNFPDVFTFPGGGFDPDPFKTIRDKSTGWPVNYRSDDLLFGRACWIPATMIPWAHTPNSDLFVQRSTRQKAQHFLYANGYQRDWYGFDYGSIIGSFDGVAWFSIGTKRRIKATSNKLFLAVNTPFGDISLPGGFSIRISESVTIDPGLNIAENDFESDGAQCQSYHSCTKDSDCTAQLGWDYACESVSGIKSTWPLFDDNAKEKTNLGTSVTLRSLFGSSSGPSKRCVYRGRGAACHPTYGSMTSTTSYSQTTFSRLHGCSANHYCADIETSVFNDKIARYAATPAQQNQSASVPVSEEDHTFGLGARVIGRPYKYNGTTTIPTLVEDALDTNLVNHLCIPGKDPDGEGSTFETMHGTVPDNSSNDNAETGDIVSNIGISVNIEDNKSAVLYNSCPIIDSNGQYYHFENPTLNLEDSTAGKFASAQNLSTNLFNTFDASAGFDNSDITALISKYTSIVDDLAFQNARCLKAPGATCFTDLDCAPNKEISTIFKAINPDDASSFSTNGYEVLYWQEELVCGQKSEKTSVNYDLKLNKCCRETGNTITIGSKDSNAERGAAYQNINVSAVAGYEDGTADEIDLSDSTRYSRINTVYKELIDEAATYPTLTVATNDNTASTHNLSQFTTLHEVASRTCCTGNWVREFHENNGGGHKWTKSKFQNLDKANFECLNYSMSNAADDLDDCLNSDTGDTCDCITDPSDANCRIRSIPQSEANRYNEFFSSLELLGIPQVLIKSDDTDFETDSTNITCTAVHASRGVAAVGDPIAGTINSIGAEGAEFENGSSQQFFKSSDTENFDTGLKKVFSEDSIACCLPAGSAVADTTPDKMCCTGKVADTGSGARCCLEDYTNVTVYFNRFVSSELGDLDDSQFDSLTGRPLNASTVENIARSRNICCSGKVARGEAFGEMGIPTATGFSSTVNRFVSGNRPEDDINSNQSNYDKGLRWNTDVYCVP